MAYKDNPKTVQDRISKLPSWARQHILELKEKNRRLQDTISSLDHELKNVHDIGGDSLWCWEDLARQEKYRIPDLANIVFNADNTRKRIIISRVYDSHGDKFLDDVIEINAGDPISISPRASNMVYVSIKEH